MKDWIEANVGKLIAAGIAFVLFVIVGIITYSSVRIDVPAEHIAVLTRNTGEDIDNGDAVAPDANHKGLQLGVLTEGRHFYNPYSWSSNVYPMITIPDGKLGVRIRQYGKNLPYGDFLATQEDQKGIVPEVLRPGRYPINGVIKGEEAKRPKNDYVEIIELYTPVTIPAGYRGVVANLAGPLPENPNVILVPKGCRGVQEETLDTGTYYLNPYLHRVNVVDCRSQRFNLAETVDMGFPSRDGFWVSLDGIIEFRVDPAKAAHVFVVYNETSNDNVADSIIHDELIRKVIMPNARSFCRLKGSDKSGRDFIGGETRIEFQKDFQTAMAKSCRLEGVDVVQALITKINPPQAIAKPVRDREVAHQKQQQYVEQKKQQVAEAMLATEKALIAQRQALVTTETTVIQNTTTAKQNQQVKVTEANRDLSVGKADLEAAKDKASAVLAGKKAEAGVIDFQNLADAAGWKTAVDALGGDGEAYARFVLYQKLAPAFKKMMVNTGDSPLMKIFEGFNKDNQKPAPPAGAPKPVAALPEPKPLEKK
jgi:regulator of protease activity HflC (stomatin/prohibitin superfamily)